MQPVLPRIPFPCGRKKSGKGTGEGYSIRRFCMVKIISVNHSLKGQMDCKEFGFSLLILISLINLAASSAMQKTLPPEFMQKNKLEDKVIYGSKIEGSSPHTGMNGGGKTPTNGENGGSTPNTPSGTAAIIGGAANNNRRPQNHHGAASCNLDRVNFATFLIIITLVSPLMKLFCDLFL